MANEDNDTLRNANPMSTQALQTPVPVAGTSRDEPAPEPIEAPPPADPNERPVSLAPDTLEDVSRQPMKAGRVEGFPGYPKTLYHPVYGARSAADPNEEANFPGLRRNWFDTAAEADAHRTDSEAQQVIHNNRSVKVTAALNGDDHDPTHPSVRGEAGVVRNSVSATESMKAGFAEPL